jgi:putative NIF3 family GTP cyclohydrolase 1 type 2
VASLNAIVEFLDTTFRVRELEEVIGFHRIHDEARVDLRPWVETAFLSRVNGLFLRGLPEVPLVAGIVYPSRRLLHTIATEAPRGTLVFSHHPMDDDFLGRGLLPTDLEALEMARTHALSIYYLHLPLDVGHAVSTSSALSQRLGFESLAPFFPYRTGALGVVARSGLARDSLVARVRERLGVERVQTQWRDGPLDPLAVVAGGGDSEEMVRAAREAGCRTYLTGIVYNRVNHPQVRNENEAFLRAAAELGMSLVGVSHYASEEPAIRDALTLMNARLGVPTRFFLDVDKLAAINRDW